jgi:hypothetical protein
MTLCNSQDATLVRKGAQYVVDEGKRGLSGAAAALGQRGGVSSRCAFRLAALATVAQAIVYLSTVVPFKNIHRQGEMIVCVEKRRSICSIL